MKTLTTFEISLIQKNGTPQAVRLHNSGRQFAGCRGLNYAYFYDVLCNGQRSDALLLTERDLLGHFNTLVVDRRSFDPFRSSK